MIINDNISEIEKEVDFSIFPGDIRVVDLIKVKIYFYYLKDAIINELENDEKSWFIYINWKSS